MNSLISIISQYSETQVALLLTFVLFFFTFNSLLLFSNYRGKTNTKLISFQIFELIVNIYTKTERSPSVYSVTSLKSIRSSHLQGYTKKQVEQNREGKKMYLITYPMVMGSKQMQGQIPTLRVTWSCLELIISHSCGSLLAPKSPKSREISLKCLLTVK